MKGNMATVVLRKRKGVFMLHGVTETYNIPGTHSDSLYRNSQVVGRLTNRLSEIAA